jgi:hypothetical protein
MHHSAIAATEEPYACLSLATINRTGGKKKEALLAENGFCYDLKDGWNHTRKMKKKKLTDIRFYRWFFEKTWIRTKTYWTVFLIMDICFSFGIGFRLITSINQLLPQN